MTATSLARNRGFLEQGDTVNDPQHDRDIDNDSRNSHIAGKGHQLWISGTPYPQGFCEEGSSSEESGTRSLFC